VFGTDVDITTATNVQESVTDVGLGALADNGGTVMTRNTASSTSLLFNSGNNAAPGLPANDANGNERVGDGTVDIGATEFTGSLVVTTELDVVDATDGLLSLREAVALANAGADADTIIFDASLGGKTVTLTAGELTLTQDVTIDGDVNGDDRADITISGNDTSRVFNITGGTTDVDLLSLTLTDGNAGDYRGGAIAAFSISTLEIEDTTIRNSTSGIGGGLSVFATDAILTNSLITGNSSSQGGGVEVTSNSTLMITNSSIHDNVASDNTDRQSRRNSKCDRRHSKCRY
jgi:hypothetical protein